MWTSALLRLKLRPGLVTLCLASFWKHSGELSLREKLSLQKTFRQINVWHTANIWMNHCEKFNNGSDSPARLFVFLYSDLKPIALRIGWETHERPDKISTLLLEHFPLEQVFISTFRLCKHWEKKSLLVPIRLLHFEINYINNSINYWIIYFPYIMGSDYKSSIFCILYEIWHVWYLNYYSE